MSWLMSGATLVATPFTLHRRLSSPTTRLCLHPCLLGAKPRQVHRFQHARLAVRAGAPSSLPVVEMEKYLYLKTKEGLWVRKDKPTSTIDQLPKVLRWAFFFKHPFHT